MPKKEFVDVRVTADADMPGKFLICALDSITTSVSDLDSENSPEIFSGHKILFIEQNHIQFEGKYEMMNLQGAKVKSGKIDFGINEIDCSELSSGIYMVTVIAGNGKFENKIWIE